MLIDPKGLLYGERIAACSDDAQLHFTRLLAASNTYGRFRMSMEWLSAKVYGSFKKKPSKQQLTALLHEYHAHHLLFVYRAADGSAWGQWEIPEKLLGQYRAVADKQTPEPPAKELAEYRAEYMECRRKKNETNPDDLLETFQKVPEVSKTLSKVPHDVLVGVDVVLNTCQAPSALAPSESKQADPRHAVFRSALAAWWKRHVNPDSEPAWDGSEARALDALLKALPRMTLAVFEQCLRHRARSTVTLTERPRKWLKTITDYENGPVDAYGKPLEPRTTAEQGKASRRTPDAQETASRLMREGDEKTAALADWRDLRQRTLSEYEAEAPAWVREALQSEEVRA